MKVINKKVLNNFYQKQRENKVKIQFKFHRNKKLLQGKTSGIRLL